MATSDSTTPVQPQLHVIVFRSEPPPEPTIDNDTLARIYWVVMICFAAVLLVSMVRRYQSEVSPKPTVRRKVAKPDA